MTIGRNRAVESGDAKPSPWIGPLTMVLGKSRDRKYGSKETTTRTRMSNCSRQLCRSMYLKRLDSMRGFRPDPGLWAPQRRDPSTIEHVRRSGKRPARGIAFVTMRYPNFAIGVSLAYGIVSQGTSFAVAVRGA